MFTRMHILSLIVASGVLLQGCSVYSEGSLRESRMEIHQGSYYDEVSSANVTPQFIDNLAQHYRRYGDGGVSATVTYDPRSKNNTAMQAMQKAGELSQALRRKGVEVAVVDVLPVKELGPSSRVIFSYDTYTAHAPKDCGLLSGFESVEHEIPDENYRIGCTVETVMARQISQPKDALGERQSDAVQDGVASYLTTVGAVYNTPNGDLGGESASE